MTEAHETVVIWWLSELEARAIGETAPEYLPEYLGRLYDDRYGRNGRGRIWRLPVMNDIVVDWPDTHLAKYLQNECGGIVLYLRDYHLLANLPGIITDLNLRRLPHADKGADLSR